MLEMLTFASSSLAPSWWANALQKFLSTLSDNFRVSLASPTTVQVVAGADDAAAVIAIAGKWRWRETTVTRAHPGGAAGTYTLWATAANNSIAGTTDNTNYAFDLLFTSGAAPAAVAGSVDIWRKIALVVWDGAQITDLQNLVGASRDTDPVSAGMASPAVPAVRARGIVGATGNVFEVDDSTGAVLFGVTPAGGRVAPAGTSLPLAAKDGEERSIIVTTADGTGVLWRFRYRAARGEWDNAGSTPLYFDDGVVRTLATTGADGGNDLGYVVGVRVPHGGVYDIEFGASVLPADGPNTSEPFVTFAIAGVLSGRYAWGGVSRIGGTGGTSMSHGTRTMRGLVRVAASATQLITVLAGKNADGVTAQFRDRFIRVTPVRLTGT